MTRSSSEDPAGAGRSGAAVKGRKEHSDARGRSAAVEQSWYFLLAPEEFGRAVPCMGAAPAAAEAKPHKQVFLIVLAPTGRESPHEEVDSTNTERGKAVKAACPIWRRWWPAPVHSATPPVPGSTNTAGLTPGWRPLGSPRVSSRPGYCLSLLPLNSGPHRLHIDPRK